MGGGAGKYLEIIKIRFRPVLHVFQQRRRPGAKREEEVQGQTRADENPSERSLHGRQEVIRVLKENCLQALQWHRLGEPGCE